MRSCSPPRPGAGGTVHAPGRGMVGKDVTVADIMVVASDRQLIGIVTESSFLRLAREALAS